MARRPCLTEATAEPNVSGRDASAQAFSIAPTVVYARVKYTYASGLGNRLWPWARCVVYSHLHGVPMVKPLWLWPMRIGPLVKQRMPVATWPGHLYMNLFRARPAEVTGSVRLHAMLRSPEIPEPASLDTPPQAEDGAVTFTGEGGMFAPLLGHEALVRNAIRTMTKERWLRVVDRPAQVPIGIHVRRSDFKVATQASQFVTEGFLRTPLSWFVEALRLVRRELGVDAPAHVVSDGRAEELRALLREPNMNFVTEGSPISDMLLLSRASVLIGSGGSSFSGWAAFLGEMPVVVHPGQDLRWFKLEPRRGQFIGELDPASQCDEFMNQVRALRRASPMVSPSR